MNRIYLDCNATTPLAQEAAAAMRPFIQGDFGNALRMPRVRIAIDRLATTRGE